MSEPFRYRQEVYRKLIHLSSLWMPAAIYFLARETALWVFFACAAAVMAYEVARRQRNGLARLLERTLGAALRPEEKGARFRPSGAIYVLGAAFLSALVFPPLVAATALAMALVGDAAAALFGRRYGRRKILDKTLEGALAFFAAAVLTAGAIVLLVPAGEGFLRAAAAAAFVAAAAELASQRLKVDDNLFVPLAAGAVLALLI